MPESIGHQGSIHGWQHLTSRFALFIDTQSVFESNAEGVSTASHREVQDLLSAVLNHKALLLSVELGRIRLRLRQPFAVINVVSIPIFIETRNAIRFEAEPALGGREKTNEHLLEVHQSDELNIGSKLLVDHKGWGPTHSAGSRPHSITYRGGDEDFGLGGIAHVHDPEILPLDGRGGTELVVQDCVQIPPHNGHQVVLLHRCIDVPLVGILGNDDEISRGPAKRKLGQQLGRERKLDVVNV